MKRRTFLSGAAAAGTAALIGLKPRDHGDAYTDYFSDLNRILLDQAPGRPLMVLDLNKLNRNCQRLAAELDRAKQFRIVAKSLPCPLLLGEVMRLMQTERLMVFHQPHLNQLVKLYPKTHMLLGKPMPIAAAATFYRQLDAPEFDQETQIVWLIDSLERLQQYLQLARSLSERLTFALEIDIGLHRGGFIHKDHVNQALKLIEDHPENARFGGFMGYDAFVGKIPGPIETRTQSFERANKTYISFVESAKQSYAGLFQPNCILNGAGSLTIKLHQQNSPLNEIAAGSCLVKPTDFDTDLLADLEPSIYIAAPVLKSQPGLAIPGIENMGKYISWWNPNTQQTFFIYGGGWSAHYEAPSGLQDNSIFGKSTNQTIVNGSNKVGLKVDDYVFLRPTQSEGIMLQFGDLVVVQNGKIVDFWPVLQG